MTDKKLTDKKCKELLEYKAKVNCEMCDLKGKGSCITCTYNLIKQFLEIFNRQNAENERLEAKVKATNDILFNLKSGSAIYKTLTTDSLEYLQIKAEAQKECAEAVKQDFDNPNIQKYGLDYVNFLKGIVDRRLKEMVDENNAG